MAQLSEQLVRDAIRCIREHRKLMLTINEVDQALHAWLALNEHNNECDRLCNNAATCGYKPYFDANGRRCTNCPVDMKKQFSGDGGR